MIFNGWRLVNKSVVRQYFAGFVVNLYIIQFGIFESWSSPMTILLTSEKTPLPSGIMTMDEASTIVSLLSVGAIFSNVVFGFVANHFGRKISLFLIGVPMIASWLLTWFAQNQFYLYASRVMGGFVSGAGYMLIPMWITETVDDNIRGAFLSTVYTTENVGFLIAYIFGNYFDYYAMPLFSVVLIAIYTISIALLPETPIYLMRQNKVEAAMEAICYYKGKDSTNQNDVREIEMEIDKIKRILDKQHRMMENSEWTPETIAITRKAITIAIVLVLLYTYSGVIPMTAYAATIFQETGSNLTPNASAIVIGFIQIGGTYVGTLLVERVGRKILLVVSCFGTALSLICMGLYMMLKGWGIHVEVVNWTPLVFFSAATFISAVGIQALALSVIFEIAPERKETFTSGFSTFLWINSFISTKYLPMFLEVVDFHNSMFVFAGVCILSAIFILLCVPETKGRSYEQIMDSLSAKTLRENECVK